MSKGEILNFGIYLGKDERPIKVSGIFNENRRIAIESSRVASDAPGDGKHLKNLNKQGRDSVR